MIEREQVRLRHMHEAAAKAIAFTQNKKRSDLDNDEVLTLALIRLLEIIGEAAKSISEETRQRKPSIPWKQIAGTRDRLIHGYWHVDLNIVWSIVTNDLPMLVRELEDLLEDEEDL
jgi:uncharacterized protein with HEPN domain